MAKPKTPKFASDSAVQDWRQFLDSQPYARGEFSLETVRTSIVKACNNKEIDNGPAALEFLYVLDQHLKTNRLPLEWWNYINIKREDHISIPGWAFSALVDCWAKYVDGDRGVSLGDAFDIGASGQGSRNNSKGAVRNRRRDFGLAFLVILRCCRVNEDGQSISVEAAVGHVASEENVGERTVSRAFKKHKETLREIVDRFGLPINFPN